MSDVFLLGAGFSVAASSEMPLTSELAEAVLDHADSDGSRYADEIGRLLEVFGPDVEQWLSLLGGDSPWYSAPERYRNLALAEEIAGWVRTALVDAESASYSVASPETARIEVEEWFGPLVRFWHQRESVVITLNYDTLVERVATDEIDVEENGRLYPLDPQMLYSRPIPHVAARFGAALTGSRVDTFRLLKPHGSINWVRDPRDTQGTGQTYLTQLDAYHPWRPGDPGPDLLAGLGPVIVPPTTAKGAYFNDPLLREQWAIAATALARARRVFIVGCSLRTADWDLRHLLQASLHGSDAEVYVADISDKPAVQLHKLLRPNDESPTDPRVNDDLVGDSPLDALLRVLDTPSEE